MRRYLVSFAVVALAWSAASVLAADLTGDQRKALDGMLEFYRHMGAMGDAKSTALADRLQDAIYKKKISFGEVPDDDNAIADPLTGTIVFNKSVVSEVNSSADEAFTGKAEFGATIAHEFEHLDQYSLHISASKAAAKAGRGHPAEQAAWNKGFDRLAIWIAHMKAELVRQEENRERMREQAWTANQLRFLCNAWSNYRNGYDQKKRFFREFRGSGDR